MQQFINIDSFEEIKEMEQTAFMQNLNENLNDIYNTVMDSNDSFYAANTKKIEAKMRLGQVKALFEEIITTRMMRPFIFPYSLLNVFPVTPSSLYVKMFLLVRLYYVRGLYLTLKESKSLTIDKETYLYDHLEQLGKYLDGENGNKAKEIQLNSSHDGEFLALSKEQKFYIVGLLDLLQGTVREEIQILLTIDDLSNVSAIKNALLALRKTEGYRNWCPPMQRFGGTFSFIWEMTETETYHMLAILLRRSQNQCEEGSQALKGAMQNVKRIMDESQAAGENRWLHLARSIQDNSLQIPEEIFWNEAVFSMARTCYITRIKDNLSRVIMPSLEKLVPRAELTEKVQELCKCVKEENQQEIAALLESINVNRFRTNVSDSDVAEAEYIVSCLAQTAALLYRIAPVLWKINDLSDNSAIMEALADLQHEEVIRAERVKNIILLGLLGLSW